MSMKRNLSDVLIRKLDMAYSGNGNPRNARAESLRTGSGTGNGEGASFQPSPRGIVQSRPNNWVICKSFYSAF
jgi:hypothetical protein